MKSSLFLSLYFSSRDSSSKLIIISMNLEVLIDSQKYPGTKMGKKRKADSSGPSPETANEDQTEVPENPLAPAKKMIKAPAKGSSAKRLIIVLENAQLESGKIGKTMELLCADKHATFLRKNGKDPTNYRPDITHQVRY